MDTFTPETRSRVMAAIRGRDTGPELFVRRALFARGFRFRVNCRDLPGRPDLKLTKYGAVILVHGCFWHGHSCHLFRAPTSNVAFWEAKILRNRERDLRDVQALSALGWRVCVVWECATRLGRSEAAAAKLVDGIAAWLLGASRFIEFFDKQGMNAADGREAKAGGRIGRKSRFGEFAAERQPGYRSRASGVQD
jgi:DNA mismatch endonuclease, patch repair protein